MSIFFFKKLVLPQYYWPVLLLFIISFIGLKFTHLTDPYFWDELED